MKIAWIIPILLIFTACGDTPKSPESEVQEVDAAVNEEILEVEEAKEIAQEAETVGMPPEHEVVAIPDFSNYISANEEVITQQMGLLDGDEHQDWLVAVRSLEEDTVDTMNGAAPRRLLILINDGNNRYTLKAESQGAILCKDCGGMMGDPFTGLAIKNRYFSTEHYGGSSWRWSRIITFKYNAEENDWFVHKDGGTSFHASDPEETYEENVQGVDELGIVRFSEYSYQ